MSFEKELEQFFSEVTDQVFQEFVDETEEKLVEKLNSAEARTSADMINKFFKDKGAEDIQVADPSTIADNIERTKDGIKVKLTEDQKRFIAADRLYGLNIIDLKYTDR